MSVTTTPPTTPATVPASQVIPFPMPWSGGMPCPPPLPGCCPPGGMDALMKCYCDIQAAQAFICAMMINCIQQNPAVTEAIIAAIEKSGSNLPLIGVTNGTDAQPGQVGEWVQLQALNVPYTGGGLQSFVQTLGVLNPGDWTIWAWMGVNNPVLSLQYTLTPQPPGFSASLNAFVSSSDAEMLVLPSGTGRALISQPSLVNMNISINAATPGGFDILFLARRAR